MIPFWKSLLLLSLCGLLAPAPSSAGEGSGPRLRLEARLKEQGARLLEMSCALAEREAAVRLRFTRKTLATHALYMTPGAGSPDYLFIGADGALERNGQPAGSLAAEGELLFTAEGATAFVDGKPLDGNLRGWKLYWAAREVRKPEIERQSFPAFAFRDSFMREEMEDVNWRKHAGQWQLRKRGAGLPKEDEEGVEQPRAVNPFSVVGEKGGVLICQAGELVHGRAEARFYFGVPPDGPVPDANTLPERADMLVAIGTPKGEQVAFGWSGADKRFALRRRRGNEGWATVKAWEPRHPPITSWVRIGIELRQGCLAAGWLDGVEVVSARLPALVTGPAQFLCGEGPVELDDAAACSLPAPDPAWTPLFVKSKPFAAKPKHDEQHEPQQFHEWASGELSFATFQEPSGNGALRFIANRRPLFGDFLYESIPFDRAAGNLPEGIYEFRVLRKREAKRVAPNRHEKLFALRCERTAKGWKALDLPPETWPPGHEEFTLRLRRSATEGQRLEVQRANAWVALSPPIAGPIHLAIGRLTPAGPVGDNPQPEHHALYDRNLVQDLFEEAPSNWSWVDGRFRMDCRWACSRNWNFLACGSTAIPYAASKRTFSGDQEHDLFISIRPAMPWDSDDTAFTFDADSDRTDNWTIFKQNGGWYNRHDLNFSFCSDGRNPLSGYAIVFAGDDNAESRLLRKGKIVARTSAENLLIPTEPDTTPVHWLWWHFSVTRLGNRILAYCNDQLMFDYTDPEPLEGGHVGFWSVRNGFVVTKVASAAARLGNEPHLFYIEASDPSPWKPLRTDAVTLRRQPGPLATRVVFNTGTGFQAVRRSWAQPVDLRRTPVMKLPLRIPAGVKINLHLHVPPRSYLIRLTAPLAQTKSLLTPAYEKGEQFRIPVIPVDALRAKHVLAERPAEGTIEVNLLALMRLMHEEGTLPETPLLESITLGNSSNEEYLLAGGGGNEAGMFYEVGEPEFLEAAGDAGKKQ